MKILFISCIKAHYIDRIIENLEKTNNQVVVLQYKSGDGIIGKMKSIASFLNQISKEVHGDYDLINVHYPLFDSIILSLKNFNKPLVVTLHGTDGLDPHTGRTGLYRKCIDYFVRKTLKKSDLITVNTKQYRDSIIERHNLINKNIDIIPAAGYNKQFFYPEIKKNSSDSLNILFVGRLVEKKGIKLFFEIIDNIKYKIKSKINITIVGRGKLEYFVNEKIKYYKNEELISIKFHKEANQLELGNIYRKNDLFIFPTMFEESLGLVGIESLACGTPVIATNIGGIPSYVKNEYNGYLCMINDVEDFSDKILKYYNLNYQEKEFFINNASSSVTKYEKDHIANLFNETLLECKKRYEI